MITVSLTVDKKSGKLLDKSENKVARKAKENKAK